MILPHTLQSQRLERHGREWQASKNDTGKCDMHSCKTMVPGVGTTPERPEGHKRPISGSLLQVKVMLQLLW